MRCKYCGAVFHDEGQKYCPYCDNDIEELRQQVVYVPEQLSEYEKERRARVAPYVPEDAKWGELHFTLLKGKTAFSPADGSRYFIIVDDYYETEIVSENRDVEVTIKLPYGEHVLQVRMFPYFDDKLESESEYARHDNVKFSVGDIPPRIELEPGGLIRHSKLSVL